MPMRLLIYQVLNCTFFIFTDQSLKIFAMMICAGNESNSYLFMGKQKKPYGKTTHKPTIIVPKTTGDFSFAIFLVI